MLIERYEPVNLFELVPLDTSEGHPASLVLLRATNPGDAACDVTPDKGCIAAEYRADDQISLSLTAAYTGAHYLIVAHTGGEFELRFWCL